MNNHVSKKQFAPLILFCYNRIDSLKQTIESIKKDELIHQTDLFIFLDGPKNNSIDAKKVKEVSDYLDTLKNISNSINLFKHKENQGLAKSIIFGINKVLKNHNNFIVLEDDIIISPHFLKFMNSSLDKYLDINSVWTINSMGINPEIFRIPNDYKYDTYFTYRNSSHGWGSWKDRWDKRIFDIDVLRNEIFETNNQLDFNKGGNDLTPMLYDLISNKIDSWSIRWSYSISKNNGVCISPVNSYSKLNFSEGTHIKGYIKAFDNILENAKEKVTYPQDIKVDDEIARNLALIYNQELPFLLDKQNERNEKYIKYLKRKSNNLKVSALTSITHGGAGKASIIATEAIERFSDVSIELLTQNQNSESFVIRNFEHPDNNFAKGLISIFSKNIYKGNTTFSLSYPSLTFEDLNVILNNSDIIHLHWLPGYISNEAIAYLSHSNIPIVWTLHDKHALTGGCHYFHGCNKWKYTCDKCPQLINNYDNITSKVLKNKLKNINFNNLTIFVLNSHFKDLIMDSILFKNSNVEIVPNCIDTNKFRPLEKIKLKIKYKIPLDKKIILYSASYESSIKGYKEFLLAVNPLDIEKFHILIVGNPPNIENIKHSYTFWGHVSEDIMVEAYNLADVTVVSSIEDNLPNIMLESISCGTPVVGFNIAGLKDTIINGYNGYLAEPFDIPQLTEAIIKAVNGLNFEKQCRDFALKNFSPSSYASRVDVIYKRLITQKNNKNKPINIPFVFQDIVKTLTRLERKVRINQNKWIIFLKSPIKTKNYIIFSKIKKIFNR